MKLILLLLITFSSAFASEQEITRLLEKWPQDFNAKNLEAACNLFAPDLIASYPGTPDRNYEGMCHTLKNAFYKNLTYEAPNIEQIIIQGDIAVVRLIWTLKTNEGSEQEKGLDVFKRQKDGTWKIAISYAYPLKI